MEVATRSLAELELVIERGLTTFVDVGTALMEIRDGRLYRETHSDFDAYCRERWGFSRVRSTQIITAAKIAGELVTQVTSQPIHEKQVRELARVEPEHRAETWQAVIDEHGPEATAQEVKAVARDQTFRRKFYPTPQPANVTAMPSWVQRLPEEKLEAFAEMALDAQLPTMVEEVVLTAAGMLLKVIRNATKEIERIDWNRVTDDMRSSETVVKHIGYIDSDWEKFEAALQNVRLPMAALRRVK